MRRLMVLPVLVALALAASTAAVGQTVVTCPVPDDPTQPPTEIPATIVGTEGNDVIRGTDGPDVIAGLGGDDRIWGLGNDDVIAEVSATTGSTAARAATSSSATTEILSGVAFRAG